ncbi:MAG: Rne/Rng family ribonuclease, partial [Tepidisphaeraceae bacterium]
MAKEMLINVSAGEECRIALLEDGKLEELYMERTSATSHVGNIYKGKVTNVEPSIQAAFVDFGIGRNGFLHISDLMPSYFGGKKGSNSIEPVGRKLGRRDRPPIQQCLRKGDEIVVQIIKEGIGTKGPTLSTYLSIPGRVLVMMPGMSKMGVSKKIEDEQERLRLRKILDGLKPPKDCGFIIRTAGIGKTKLEIERDLKYLARLWETLKKKIDNDKPPVELYTEGDLVTRTVRDVFTSDVDSIIVDDKDTAKKIKDFIKLAMPRTKNKVQEYKEQVPLFHKYEIEEVIEGMYSRRVPLPSGGSLIIDQTEAVVAIDVNSGKFRDHSDAETTAFKTDLEAADEIPRQLRLRDMGGVIICDFIDLRFERHRREVEQKLFDNLKNDRAKTRMLRMSQFGIIEMTRQRMRPSLRKSIYQDCKSCAGQGMVKTPESMALDVMRKLRIGLDDAAVVRVQLAVHPDVAIYLLNKKRNELAELEEATEKKIAIVPETGLAMDEVKFELYDSRDGYIYIAELGMALPAVHHQQRQGGQQRQGRDRDRGRDQQRSKPKHDRHEETLDAEELFTEDEGEAPKAKAGAKKSEGLEETGNDDEATVVEVDEGGDEMPGRAAEGFFDPSENQRYGDRNRRGGRRGRGRDDRRHNGDRQQNRQPALPAGEHAMDETFDEVEGELVDESAEGVSDTRPRQEARQRDQRGGQRDQRGRDSRGGQRHDQRGEGRGEGRGDQRNDGRNDQRNEGRGDGRNEPRNEQRPDQRGDSRPDQRGGNEPRG